ncbi:MAG: D-aminoacylase [Bacillota bacterium]|nr:D-aminoacylase [Bacillota bacterium]MDD3850712.1 D-aminoacylase [Bacillota bacterium]MDD4707966.1 D-aminoacylase [Bacillota bacterium]
MFDLVIKNAKVIDGSGGPWYKADVAVKDGKISKIGKFKDVAADNIIDAAGKVVSPGFIDAHSHSDFVAAAINNAEGKITQGVTTEVSGVCGITAAPVNPDTISQLKQYLGAFMPKGLKLNWEWRSLGDWMDIVDKQGNATNLAMFVGHGSIRIAVMGFANRAPSAGELEDMKKLVRQSMEQGALGISTGLIYPPGCYSDKEELIELCKVIAEYGGIYVTHMRNESGEIIPALEEAIDIGRQSGCAVHISHHKVAGRSNLGLINKTLGMMEEARLEGIDVTCDVYPYIAGSTLISALLPKWVHDGGVDKMLNRLKDSDIRDKIAKELEEDVPGWENLVKNGGWDKIMICSCINNKSWEGRTIKDIADELGVKPAEALFDIIISERGDVTIALFMMDEDDNKKIVAHRLSMIGSDGFASSFSGILSQGKPHPRSLATFPRVLGRYVRENKVISLETAIWKITGFAAQRFGLHDRGLIREGLQADLVVFDPDTIIDKADYKNPFQQAEGIDYVIMKGEIVVDHKVCTGKVLGCTLRYSSRA